MQNKDIFLILKLRILTKRSHTEYIPERMKINPETRSELKGEIVSKENSKYVIK